MVLHNCSEKSLMKDMQKNGLVNNILLVLVMHSKHADVVQVSWSKFRYAGRHECMPEEWSHLHAAQSASSIAYVRLRRRASFGNSTTVSPSASVMVGLER